MSFIPPSSYPFFFIIYSLIYSFNFSIHRLFCFGLSFLNSLLFLSILHSVVHFLLTPFIQSFFLSFTHSSVETTLFSFHSSLICFALLLSIHSIFPSVSLHMSFIYCFSLVHSCIHSFFISIHHSFFFLPVHSYILTIRYSFFASSYMSIHPSFFPLLLFFFNLNFVSFILPSYFPQYIPSEDDMSEIEAAKWLYKRSRREEVKEQRIEAVGQSGAVWRFGERDH